jgi:hypothetical protein
MKLVARDGRIPKPLRWIAGLSLLPIPGPVDEVILIVVAPILFVFYRGLMREAWERAQGPGSADPDQVPEATGLRE